MHSFSILLYTQNEYAKIECTENKCEDVCREICQKLGFKPVVMLLFSLRNAKTLNFLPGCTKLSHNEDYEFRLRFQVNFIKKMFLNYISFNFFFFSTGTNINGIK